MAQLFFFFKGRHVYLQMTLKSLPEDGHIKSQLCTAEIRESPTKPSGKGSKRKQDELDEDDYMDEEEEEQEGEAEEEEGRQTWVEALTQELEDEGPDVDPDYEVGDLCKPSLGCLTNVPPHTQRLHILYSLDLIFFRGGHVWLDLCMVLREKGVFFFCCFVLHVSP